MSGTKFELIQRIIENKGCSSQNDEHEHGIVSGDEHDDTDEKSVGDNKFINDPMLSKLPPPVLEAFLRYAGNSSSQSPQQPQLLPIQQKSYDIIRNGDDAVLFSPTGTGKTLAYTIPLAARLWEWKRDGSLATDKTKRSQMMQQIRRQSRNDSLPPKPMDPATPCILVVEPSRELARQVGKVWTKFHPTAAKSKRHVVTVYGGVPMARHAALLDSKVDVVIGTPGRIRELIREKYLSTSKIRSIVLDEADTLLNFKDVPEVEWLLDGMREDYQLVLASATVNKRVEKFVGDVMELEVGEDGYVVVDPTVMQENGVVRDEYDEELSGINDLEFTLGMPNTDGIEQTEGLIDSDNGLTADREQRQDIPKVRHWSMAASSSSRTILASDLIVTMAPRRGIIFAPSKAEVELVAQQLSERLAAANDVSIHVLHGDMVQAARARAIAAFREDVSDTSMIHVTNMKSKKDAGLREQEGRSRISRILVATDVASRGLDLPAVDLVVQVSKNRDSKFSEFLSLLYPFVCNCVCLLK